jgi:hypothetical protein
VVVPMPFYQPRYVDRWDEGPPSEAFTSLYLFWDKVAAILTPAQAEQAYSRHEFTRQLVDSGFVEFIDPGRVMDDRMLLDFNLRLHQILNSSGGDWSATTTKGYGGYPFEYAVAVTSADSSETDLLRLVSYTRVGAYRYPSLAAENVEGLIQRGLAGEGSTRDRSGERYLLVSSAGARLVAAVHASLLRESARRTLGLDAYPLAVSYLDEQNWLPPQFAEIVLSDLEVVVPTMRELSIDDLLSFRAAHGREFRAYMADVRRFVADAANTSAGSARELLADRREALRDASRRLSSATRRDWKGPAIAVGTGAAALGVGVAIGEPIAPTLIGLGGAVAGAIAELASPTTGTPFTYLLSVKAGG